jgi:hypothetical protein
MCAPSGLRALFHARVLLQGLVERDGAAPVRSGDVAATVGWTRVPHTVELKGRAWYNWNEISGTLFRGGERNRDPGPAGVDLDRHEPGVPG